MNLQLKIYLNNIKILIVNQKVKASNNEKGLWTLDFPFYTKAEECPHPHYERLKEEFKKRVLESA